VALNNNLWLTPEGLRSSDGSGQREEFECAGCDRQYAFICGTVPDFSNDRELRAKVWSMYVKGDNENEFDNKANLYRFCS
jgi:hypothetical protein